MSLRNLIGERRSVRVGGRRFVVRRPTVAVIELALELYPAEIAALCQVAEKTSHGLTAETVLPAFTYDEARAARVLSGCVEAESDEAWPVRELAAALVSMCDIGRIVESLNLSTGAPDHAPPPGPSEQHVAIVRLALKFGVTPFEIMQWPYEGFLDVLDVLPMIGEGGESEQAREYEERFHPDFLSECRKTAKRERN